MSDSFFDDDDDELLLQLIEATQRPPQPQQHFPAGAVAANPSNPSNPANAPSSDPPNHLQQQLYSAQGEISILRAQLQALQNQKSEEIARLSKESEAAKAAASEHVTLLKQTVDKLEDEKKFLGNEIRSLSSVKRRRVDGNSHVALANREGGVALPANNGLGHGSPTDPASKQVIPAPLSRIQLQDDWAQLCQYMWNYTINGSERTSMDFLAKIGLDTTLEIDHGLTIPANTPMLSCLWDLLLKLKHFRLDNLVLRVCEVMLSLINELLRLHEKGHPGVLVSIPFLVSLIHASVNFKTSAVSEALAKKLVERFCQILQKFVFVLHLNDEEDETFAGHNLVTYQQRLIENFILVVSLDVLESVAIISTPFGAQFCRRMWDDGTFDIGLMQRVLPENTERFISSVQINLVSNLVEILSASISENRFCTSDDKLNRLVVKSLLKVFIIDIGIKEDFMFYGLNRVLGNNSDFENMTQAVPQDPERVFNKTLVTTPYPITCKTLSPKEKFQQAFQHDCHLLTLRVRIVLLLEGIVISDRMDLVNLKENIKSIVRIIGYEQNHLVHQPRYELVHMRITIIGVFVRILFYIIEEQKNINTLIYPETLYEIFVVLMKIAFASDSLSFEAHELLCLVRTKGIIDMGVFNKSCEMRSREMAHFDLHGPSANKYADLAGIEGDFANGLEFPYELDTIEIAREILSVCVNHDEADNLYYNMHKETQT